MAHHDVASVAGLQEAGERADAPDQPGTTLARRCSAPERRMRPGIEPRSRHRVPSDPFPGAEIDLQQTPVRQGTPPECGTDRAREDAAPAERAGPERRVPAPPPEAGGHLAPRGGNVETSVRDTGRDERRRMADQDEASAGGQAERAGRHSASVRPLSFRTRPSMNSASESRLR